MKVRCIADEVAGFEGRYAVERGAEYRVLALEARLPTKWAPGGFSVHYQRPDEPGSAPISCFEILDPHVSPSWRLGLVNGRWLLGYPFMHDLDLLIGLEREMDPQFLERYRALLAQLDRDEPLPK
jgi:hypothetical protein